MPFYGSRNQRLLIKSAGVPICSSHRKLQRAGLPQVMLGGHLGTGNKEVHRLEHFKRVMKLRKSSSAFSYHHALTILSNVSEEILLLPWVDHSHLPPPWYASVYLYNSLFIRYSFMLLIIRERLSKALTLCLPHLRDDLCPVKKSDE